MSNNKLIIWRLFTGFVYIPGTCLTVSPLKVHRAAKKLPLYCFLLFSLGFKTQWALSDAVAFGFGTKSVSCQKMVTTMEPKCLKRKQLNFRFFEANSPLILKGNSGIFKPRPYFWHEIRLSTHREQFGESRRPLEDI